MDVEKAGEGAEDGDDMGTDRSLKSSCLSSSIQINSSPHILISNKNNEKLYN